VEQLTRPTKNNQVVLQQLALITACIGFFLQWYALGVFALFAFAFVRFVMALGQIMPIKEMMLLIAVAQWLVGPYFAYNLPETFAKYNMAVEQAVYFSYALPTLIAFTFGLMAWPKDFKPQERFDIMLKPYTNELAYIFIGIGMGVNVFGFLLPSSLGFVAFLLGGLVYIGALIYYSNKSNRYRILSLVLALLWLLSQATNAGMFHTLILWGAIFFCFYDGIFQRKLGLKVLVIVVGSSSLIFIQQIKQEFRALNGETDLSSMELFWALTSSKLTNETPLVASDQEWADLNVRLNQGWIIARVISNVPVKEPFAEGETIMEAIENALVPRIFNPDKKKAGGQENFEKYTGLYLNKNTSMGLSVLGEGYANYGYYAWVFLFIWGYVLRQVLNFLNKKSNIIGLVYFFIPLIFLQVVKAETEFYVVLNHLFKSMILLFILMPFLKKWEKKYKYESPLAPETPS